MSQQEQKIKIEVETEYLEKDSVPEEAQYVFRYTITIVNLNSEAVTLKSRHWIITDSDGKETEVQGEGVVGETPTIEADTAYQYTSGTVLEAPLGFMEGSYTMERIDGSQFDAVIPVFRLAANLHLH